MSKGLSYLKNIDSVFKALSNETRRHIVVVLNSKGGKLSAGQIVNRFSYSWPTITKHLNILIKASIVTREKEGREQIYTLNRNLITSTLGDWVSHIKE